MFAFDLCDLLCKLVCFCRPHCDDAWFQTERSVCDRPYSIALLHSVPSSQSFEFRAVQMLQCGTVRAELGTFMDSYIDTAGPANVAPRNPHPVLIPSTSFLTHPRHYQNHQNGTFPSFRPDSFNYPHLSHSDRHTRRRPHLCHWPPQEPRLLPYCMRHMWWSGMFPPQRLARHAMLP